MFDICIIGGGAAGMAAAISAKESDPSLSVVILEKKDCLGKKILATGNGRCNLSNTACSGVGETLAFFRHLGVLTRTDEQGRIYPYTEEAKAVRDALAQKIYALSVPVMTDAEVVGIEKGDGFTVKLKDWQVHARNVLIACGGKAGSSFGSTGDGFRFARQLGHTVNRLVPVLTAVEVKENIEKLAGIRAKAGLSLEYRGETIFCEEGEIQFTKMGISGICVFNLSRFLLIPQGRTLADGFDDYRILIDFFPGIEDVMPLLMERQAAGFTRENLLRFLVRRPLADRIYEAAYGQLSEAAVLLKAFPLSPKGVKGWDFAQATRGGVSLDEIRPDTMESKLVPGLYFAGEVVDYDGPCGGFNLQHAWETGIKAGKDMTR